MLQPQSRKSLGFTDIACRAVVLLTKAGCDVATSKGDHPFSSSPSRPSFPSVKIRKQCSDVLAINDFASADLQPSAFNPQLPLPRSNLSRLAKIVTACHDLCHDLPSKKHR
jgi:hypothetical protein